MKNLQNQIRIVLVEPSHPGNIGGVARAMKNMGLSELYLVNPKRFPHPEAEARATNAPDILEHARVVSDLDHAIAGCHVVMGTSARMRELPQSMFTVRQAAEFVVREPESTQVAILFGNEKYGLTNEDLRKCQYHIRIPTTEEFSSLNLAAAVQVVVYELFVASLDDQGQSKVHQRTESVTVEQIERLYQHIRDTMIEIEFLDPEKPRHFMPRLRQIIDRSRIDENELNLLHGMMTAMQQYIKMH